MCFLLAFACELMMKPQDTMAALTPKIEITVFQALTLLAKEYRHHQTIYTQIESIYLTGARGKLAEYMLNALLDDPFLANYSISASKQAINNDPVRRYFESHLCHNTLATSLDFLDVELLEKHLNAIINRFEKEDRAMLVPMIEGRSTPSRPNEYSDGIAKLSKSSSYQSLQPEETSGRSTPEDVLGERKRKLALIAQCMYASMYVDEALPSGEIPLNIYFRPNSAYDDNHRGRTPRLDIDQLKQGHSAAPHQTVCPHTLGIMRSFMPLPMGDALLAEAPSQYPRPADKFTYAKGSYAIPDQIFSNKVTPFVSSISGTMLIKLRVIAQLLRDKQFAFSASNNPKNSKNIQLELFLKTHISYMIYHAGGHSLEEYIMVLNQAIVLQEFRNLAGFSDLTLINLFQNSNMPAFNKTIEQTIAYNENILLKKKLHAELETNHKIKFIVNQELYKAEQANKAHPAIIGTMHLNLPGDHASYTILDSSIVGAACLFALIRLLNHKSVPPNKQNDVSQRLKQLCFVICVAAIAYTVSAKIIKQKEVFKPKESTGKPNSTLSALVSTTTGKVLDYSLFRSPKNAKRKSVQPVTQHKAFA